MAGIQNAGRIVPTPVVTSHQHMNSDLLVLTFVPSHHHQEGRRAVEGEHYLVGIIQRMGYRSGNVYSCKMFVQDIGEELPCGVKVTFGPHPDGRPVKLLRLHEVHVLSNNEAEEMVRGGAHSFEDGSFMFENFPIWNILG